MPPDEVSHLLEFFTYCLEEVSSKGESYISLIQEHFHFFEEGIKNKESLIDDILGAGFSKKQFKLRFYALRHTSLWSEFTNELKYVNRFFPKNSMYSSLFNNIDQTDGDFSELLGQLTKPVTKNEIFYRARISEGKLKSSEMKMPPKGIATSGRANPIGISYLYLAENIDTCIAEVRPSKSSCVRVSEFKLLKDLRVLDLSAPRKDTTVTSFEGDQAEDILNYVNLLETLSYELSKPVLPDKSNIDYLPTQFLCEFIKSVGKFDGIIFKSSFGYGNNYVFYSDDSFLVSKPVLYNVISTKHEIIKV
ncbi:RES family NAD+ phosphorylase [Rahnella perminowiae]|uniref:RES family NAD+ phosphorylase n=1 Tax=Rahnella perminowiae TaxID=2816244 RepID=UPI00215BD849|nr:RES family NAD+ phosphorylase [Rahnella perminowiae]MCR9002729.1 RES family NAD+ phosphorylase [Rahnella perminowiae]